jgi:hypothetical protein
MPAAILLLPSNSKLFPDVILDTGAQKKRRWILHLIQKVTQLALIIQMSYRLSLQDMPPNPLSSLSDINL